MSIGAFETASIVVVVVVAALAGYLNHLTLKLPQTIARTLTGVLVSVLVALADVLLPSAHLSRTIGGFMDNIDRKTALLNVMLSFLLFAGALHVDLHELRRGKWLIAVLSTAGVCVSTVLFAILLGAASAGRLIGPLEGLEIFAVAAFGGVTLGLALEILGYWMVRSIEDYVVEALVTVAIVMGGYSIAVPRGVSGPVAMAMAGLIIGNYGVTNAMSKVSQRLSAEVLGPGRSDPQRDPLPFDRPARHSSPRQAGAVRCGPGYRAAGADRPRSLRVAAARRLAQSREVPPGLPDFDVGGLRGGICIAMALSLPDTPIRDVMLAAAYVVVMFSVIVQGVTIERLIKHTLLTASSMQPSSQRLGISDVPKK